MTVGTGVLTALTADCDDVRDAMPEDTVGGVAATYVARPASTEETAALLRIATELDLAVVARGAGTKLAWGAPPERADLVVDLSRLAAVVDHAAGDLVAVAQAGCPLATLQAALAPSGQRLAIDEPVPGSSLGGSIATNSSGPRRMLHGTFRDLMIGTTVVRADGVVAKSGGRVVKNVAGYDLGKLMTGSFGTLAIITEAVFRLHPVPAASAVLTTAVTGPARAAAAVAGVLHSDVVPTAVEIDWTGREGLMAVLLEGSEAGVAARTSAARTALAGAGAPEVELQAAPPPWWGRYPWTDGQLALKLTCALSAVEQLLGAAEEHGAALRGSAGSGVLYGALDATAAGRVAPLREICRAHGGSLVVLDGPAETTARLDRWGPISALDLMRAVKHQFDPRRRLSPGRFVGGI